MAEENGHDWITNGLEQAVPFTGPQPDDEPRVEHVPEDLASVARDAGMLINPAIARHGKLA